MNNVANKLQQQTRNQFLDYSKGFLIYLVTLGHVIQVFIYKNSGFYKDHLFKAIYMFHMPLFMAVAGYLAYGSLQRSNSIQYIYHRAVNLILPIISWSLLTFFILAIGHHKNHGNESLVDLMFSSLWFLWSLFYSCMVVSFCKIINKDNIYGAIASSFVVILLPTQYIPVHYNIYLFKFILPFFWIGYLTCKNSEFITKFYFNKYVLLLLMATSLLCYVIWTEDAYVYVTQMDISTFYHVKIVIFRYFSGIVVSLTALIVLSMISDYFFKKQLIWMGRRSIYIFVLQGYFFGFFDTIVLGHIRFSLHYEICSFTLAPLIALILVLMFGSCSDFVENSPLFALLFFGKRDRTS